MKGVVAAGHTRTAEAGRDVLQAGGNAFDAAVAAMLMACVCESTLTSLGGGGFLLAHQAGSLSKGEPANQLFDFFTQTPKNRSHCETPNFYPVEVDFGDTTQTFHIGLASTAVPGLLAGVLTVHKTLGQVPLSVVAAPAIAAAREGVVVNSFHAYVYSLLEPILLAQPQGRELYAPDGDRLQAGETFHMSAFADTLEYLAGLGDDAAMRAFYEGEIAQKVVADCQAQGGYLTLADFKAYSVVRRSPLSVNYRGVQILTNPPPSAGGALIAFCLELLDRFPVEQMTFGSQDHVLLLSQAMRWTNEARRSHLDSALFDPEIARKFVDKQLVEKYIEPIRNALSKGLNRWGSTTHISVMDELGNAASVTSSNGEGSSYFIPGTQIMMNNMLGEEDLNPQGFNQWALDQRQSSMMAPTLILKDNKPQLVLGSGGSNRIRTAILQVISNIVDFGMPVNEAVTAPRIHWERGTFHLEPGLATDQSLESFELENKQLENKQIVSWQQQNMFFGGVHTVAKTGDALAGAGDCRRSGAVAIAD